jgi:hypothetical protein
MNLLSGQIVNQTKSLIDQANFMVVSVYHGNFRTCHSFFALICAAQQHDIFAYSSQEASEDMLRYATKLIRDCWKCGAQKISDGLLLFVVRCMTVSWRRCCWANHGCLALTCSTRARIPAFSVGQFTIEHTTPRLRFVILLHSIVSLFHPSHTADLSLT